METGRCAVHVRDSGVGISAALLPHIFDLFTQGERSLDRSQGGLGIGLALVRQLTQLHDGTVEVFSRPGKGSEFVVRLPVVVAEAHPPPGPAAIAGVSIERPLRVLVVDDTADSVLSFIMLLEASGHQVETASDGPTGLQAAIRFRPEVVLLDIGLPGLNGYEVARRIREQSHLAGIVLIALTGYGQDSDRDASLQAGFDYHLVKPARIEQIQEILTRVGTRISHVVPEIGALI